MSNEVLVKVEGVSKKFCRSLKRSMWYGVQDVGSELLGRTGHHGQLRKNEFWAVDDVSFELRRGECLGLIGPNGAGKSTLLKMLNGLIKPDKGRIALRGRVGALIELGAGFNPVLTARENIYVNGSVLGFTKREIDRQFDSIVDFASIEEFVDTPVQSFSSGMKVRLGFAIAAQMEPSILLIDEVLAVGDIGFRAKCYNRIHDIASKTAVIFVSHDLTHLGRICNRGLVLEKGIEVYSGGISDALPHYQEVSNCLDHESVRAGNGLVRYESIEVLDSQGRSVESIPFGGELTVRCVVHALADVRNVVIDIAFLGALGEFAGQSNNSTFPLRLDFLAGEHKVVTIAIPHLFLNPGVYALSALIHSRTMSATFDWLHSFASIKVQGTRASAPYQVPASWSAQSESSLD